MDEEENPDPTKMEIISGWVASCLTIIIFIQKLPPFVMVLKGNLNYQESPAFYMIMCHISCLLMMMYGDQVFSEALKTCGMVSCTICVICISIYLLFEFKEYTMSTILNAILFYMASSAFYDYLNYKIDEEDVIGKVGIGSSLSIYVFHLNAVLNVIKYKNIIFLDVNISFQILAASIFWCIYSYTINDIYIIICFLMGGIVSIIEIVTFYTFKDQYPAIIPTNGIFPEGETIEIEDKSIKK